MWHSFAGTRTAGEAKEREVIRVTAIPFFRSPKIVVVDTFCGSASVVQVSFLCLACTFQLESNYQQPHMPVPPVLPPRAPSSWYCAGRFRLQPPPPDLRLDAPQLSVEYLSRVLTRLVSRRSVVYGTVTGDSDRRTDRLGRASGSGRDSGFAVIEKNSPRTL